MALEVGIRIDDREVRKMLREARRKSSDLRPVWGGLNSRVIQPAMLKRFDTAGAHLGTRWAPLTPASRERRLRRGGNKGGLNRPLWDTNQLRRAWVKPSGESIIAIEKLRFERGVTVPHAAPHQTGGKIKRWGDNVFNPPKTLPRREQITEQLKDHVAKEAAERIARHIAED